MNTIGPVEPYQHLPLNGLPDWLTAGPTPSVPTSKESKSLSFVEFDLVFPRVLEQICSGSALSAALRELPIFVDSGAFIRWLKKNQKNYQLYKEAKEIRTEVWAGKLLEHAKGVDETGQVILEEVARSRLVVEAYKWLMGADNRKTYGESKAIEVNASISIRTALEQANSRLSVAVEEDVIDAQLIGDGEDE